MLKPSIGVYQRNSWPKDQFRQATEGFEFYYQQAVQAPSQELFDDYRSKAWRAWNEMSNLVPFMMDDAKAKSLAIRTAHRVSALIWHPHPQKYRVGDRVSFGSSDEPTYGGFGRVMDVQDDLSNEFRDTPWPWRYVLQMDAGQTPTPWVAHRFVFPVKKPYRYNENALHPKNWKKQARKFKRGDRVVDVAVDTDGAFVYASFGMDGVVESFEYSNVLSRWRYRVYFPLVGYGGPVQRLQSHLRSYDDVEKDYANSPFKINDRVTKSGRIYTVRAMPIRVEDRQNQGEWLVPVEAIGDRSTHNLRSGSLMRVFKSNALHPKEWQRQKPKFKEGDEVVDVSAFVTYGSHGTVINVTRNLSTLRGHLHEHVEEFSYIISIGGRPADYERAECELRSLTEVKKDYEQSLYKIGDWVTHNGIGYLVAAMPLKTEGGAFWVPLAHSSDSRKVWRWVLETALSRV